MTTPAKPTIDEQMCVYSGCDFPRAPCIGNCKRITEAAGRPEPVAHLPKNALDFIGDKNITTIYKDECGSVTFPIYGPDLLAYADRMAADAHHYRQKSDMLSDAAFQSEERAETAERQLAELQAKHEGLVKRLREPTEEMVWSADSTKIWDKVKCDCGQEISSGTSANSRIRLFKAMSAVALDKGWE